MIISFIKKTIAVLLVNSLVLLTAQAQDVELSIMGGYQFFGKTTTSKGEMQLKESPNLHINLQVGSEDGGFQLLYIYQPTSLNFHPYGSFSNPTKITDINMHYIMGGGNYNINPDATVIVFGGLLAGIGIMAPSDSKYNTISRMTFGLDAGLKAEITDYLGVKLQGTYLLPVQYTGGGVVVGNNGVNYGVTSGSLFSQLAVDLGLMISF